jgi:hypothetical protein
VRAEANLPDSKYLRGRLADPSTGRLADPTFSMEPGEVLFDRRLTHRDHHVYNILAYYRSGPSVNVGERRLAGACGISRRDFREVRDKLSNCGHLECVNEKGSRERGRYRLTSPTFAIPAFADVGVEIGFVAPMVTCPKCGKRCGGLLKVGWCRSCNWFVKMDPLVRRMVRQELASEKA